MDGYDVQAMGFVAPPFHRVPSLVAMGAALGVAGLQNKRGL